MSMPEEPVTGTATLSDSASINASIGADGKAQVGVISVPGPKGADAQIVAANLIDISGLADIDITSLSDGSMLMYSESLEKWVATNELEPETGTIILSGGFF
jgi:hypothetical protein